MSAAPESPPGRLRLTDPSNATVLFVTAAALLRLAPVQADTDLWGHLLFGLRHLESGALARVDPYSYTAAGLPWWNHEWMAEGAFAVFWRLGGAAGLVALHALLVGVLFALIAAHLRARRVPAVRIVLAAFAVAWISEAGLVTLRPQHFTYLGFALLLLALDAAERGRTRALLFLPPLFALWVNLHGGFLAGIGVLGTWTAVRLAALALATRKSPARGPLFREAALVAACGLAALAATLANPYGTGLWRELIRTATGPRLDIGEWHALSATSREGTAFLLLLAASAWVVIRGRSGRSPSRIAVLLLLAPLPFLAMRHAPLSALGLVILSAEAAGSLPVRKPRPKVDRTLALLFLAATPLLILGTVPAFRCIPVASAGPLPVRAVEILRRSGVSGNVAAEFDWGEYLIWHLSPQVKVAIDGRRETVYPDRVHAEHLRFLFGDEGWDSLVRRPETDAALVGVRRPAATLLARHAEWELVYGDEIAALFLRKGSPLLPLLAAVRVPVEIPAGGEGVCFP